MEKTLDRMANDHWYGFTTQQGMQLYIDILNRRLHFCNTVFKKDPLEFDDFNLAYTYYGSFLKYAYLITDDEYDESYDDTLLMCRNDCWEEYSLDAHGEQGCIREMITQLRNIIENMGPSKEDILDTLTDHVACFNINVTKRLKKENRGNIYEHKGLFEWDYDKDISEKTKEKKKELINKMIDFIAYIEKTDYFWNRSYEHNKEEEKIWKIKLAHYTINLSTMEYYEYLLSEYDFILTEFCINIESNYYRKTPNE